MDAVLLALVSAVLFGAMTVALRLALRTVREAEVAAFVTSAIALLVAATFAVFSSPAEVRTRDVLVFGIAGILAPGASQTLFTLGVRDAGASRTSVVTGTAPLFAVLIALTILSEPFRAPLVLGTILVVIGGVLLVRERERPEHFRLVGLGFALAGSVVFAVRDNLVRWASADTPVPSVAAAAAALLVGALVMLAYAIAVHRRRTLVLVRSAVAPVLPVGVLFGLSYVALFEAYYRGRVSVVSPIVATESLWGVLLSALVIGRSELIGRRLVAGALVIVAGGALIGAFR